MSKETEVTFEQIERETFIGNALATGGHYQAVKPNQYFKVTGNRYNGSNTPDIVRDLWSTPSELVAWMESEYGDYDIDAAASKENAVCEKFYSKETNCLKRWWGYPANASASVHGRADRRFGYLPCAGDRKETEA